MKLPQPKISWSVSRDGVVSLKSDRVAVYVVLTTQAQGRFSENAFLMDTPTKDVSFLSFSKVLDVKTLRDTLRVEHVQQYQ